MSKIKITVLPHLPCKTFSHFLLADLSSSMDLSSGMLICLILCAFSFETTWCFIHSAGKNILPFRKLKCIALSAKQVILKQGNDKDPCLCSRLCKNDIHGRPKGLGNRNSLKTCDFHVVQ